VIFSIKYYSVIYTVFYLYNFVTVMPHILLLYSRDCEPFMDLMVTFRNMLRDVIKSEVCLYPVTILKILILCWYSSCYKCHVKLISTLQVCH